jgi:death on curing protein
VISPPRFLSVEDVLILHALAIEDQGGDASLRDRPLLESAIATPAQQFSGAYLHEDVPAMAAAYAFHICMNHPFVDGNKRAAVAAMIAFLSDNGWTFNATADEAEPVVLQLAAGSLDKSAFTNWARKYMREKPKMELREFFARLKYQDIAEFLQAGLVHDRPDLAQKERFDTIIEAAKSIPAIHEANIGASASEQKGDETGATILRAQSQLLTAIYRIAQDMGYEW